MKNLFKNPLLYTNFLLIALVALLTLGGLYFLVSNLSPEFMRGRQQQRTGAALTEAREALKAEGIAIAPMTEIVA